MSDLSSGVGTIPIEGLMFETAKKLYYRVEILMADFATHYLGNFVLLTVVQTIRYGL